MACLHDGAILFFGVGASKLGALGVAIGYAAFMSFAIIVGPTLFDHVPPDDPLATTELFGLVLSMMRVPTLQQAVAQVNRLSYGNGATIFTSSGAAARQFCAEIQCGMVGVNVGVPAPMAAFPFAGWNDSFYGDLHVQGMEGLQFYTRQKIVLSRWDSDYIRQMGW
jgi:malonate-semialdehyde dehydrogenase (acetylating)/methylmalonate-semialdehyde dehydrogenase